MLSDCAPRGEGRTLAVSVVTEGFTELGPRSGFWRKRRNMASRFFRVI